MKQVIHATCGGQIGWVPDWIYAGNVMRAEDFTHIDGTKPVMGTKMEEKCPRCGKWVKSAKQLTIEGAA